MKYKVDIVETLKRTVCVEADSEDEAQEKVYEEWYRGIHILSADDFKEVDFVVGKVNEKL